MQKILLAMLHSQQMYAIIHVKFKRDGRHRRVLPQVLLENKTTESDIAWIRKDRDGTQQ